MKPKAYYNEKCSICRIEINHYKKICKTIDWIDINNNHELNNKGLKNKNQILRRMHVQNDDKILIGIDAFIFIWSKIPKYRILSKLLKFPVVYQLSFVAYEILAFILFIKNYQQFTK